jgi:hypothetical protein
MTASQVSAPLQSLPSSHLVASGVWVQLFVASSHASLVQATPSSQLGGVPAWHAPPTHVSAPLQYVPSSHCASLVQVAVPLPVEVVVLVVAPPVPLVVEEPPVPLVLEVEVETDVELEVEVGDPVDDDVVSPPVPPDNAVLVPPDPHPSTNRNASAPRRRANRGE